MKIPDLSRYLTLLFLGTILSLYSQRPCHAQTVHLKLISTPQATPPGSTFFVASNYNEWDAANTAFKFREVDQGIYVTDIPRQQDTLLFKITRGSWTSVEGDGLGQKLNNRTYIFRKNQHDTVTLAVKSWEDIRPAQTVRLIIHDGSHTTPDSASIYLTGNINNWQPGHANFRLKQLMSHTYAIDIPEYDDTIKYKYTRGNWQSVEGDKLGAIREERIISPGMGNEVYDTIRTWEDKAYPRRFSLYIEKWPENTPRAADIYVTGNFNNWDPGDARYILSKTDTGYFIDLNYGSDTLIYKFTRGDWPTVEGRNNGLAIDNRMIIYADTQEAMAHRIQTWEDLEAGGFNLYTLSLIIPVALGILLIFALHGIRDVESHTPFLQVLTGIIIISLIFRVMLYSRDVFNWYPQLIVFSDFIYFLFAPVFLLYLNRFLGYSNRPSLSSYILFLFPMAVFCISYIFFFTIEYETFIFHIVNDDFRSIFSIAGLVGLVFNIYCWILGVRLYKKSPGGREMSEKRRSQAKILLIYNGFILIFWSLAYILGVLDALFTFSLEEVVNVSIDVCWLLFGSNICLYTFLSIRNPELYKASLPEKLKTDSGTTVDIDHLGNLLDDLMREQKPYLNENLSLQTLATQMDVNVHHLSRVINDKFRMNFSDYVNNYRIEEFVRMANDPRRGGKTYLSIAYESGFNSKSTFNRAFKKMKNQSPSEYFKQEKAT